MKALIALAALALFGAGSPIPSAIDTKVDLLEEALSIAIRESLSPELRAELERDLGVTWMVFGECQNCAARHRASSCIVPFLAQAQHTLPASARKAGDYFLAYLSARPEDVQIRFLLNVVRQISGDYPREVPESLRFLPGTFAPEVEMVRWKDRAPELGLATMDLAGGAVMDDFDGDGFLDLISTSSHPCEPMKAFRNDGHGGFENVTIDWGLDGQLGGQYPGDGYANALFENPGPARSWVVLRFVGKKANRFAVGARLELQVHGPSGERTLYRTVGSGGSFGGSSLQQEIGLDDATEILRLQVRWPGSGTVEEHRSLEIGKIYRVTEGLAEAEEIESTSFRLGGDLVDRSRK
jgi:hypothetical protein